MAKKLIKDYFEEYKKQQAERIKNAGLDDLTQEQIDIILEPSEAPENYYCDGEISSEQAYVRWASRLRLAGLTPLQIFKANKLVFG